MHLSPAEFEEKIEDVFERDCQDDQFLSQFSLSYSCCVKISKRRHEFEEAMDTKPRRSGLASHAVQLCVPDAAAAIKIVKGVYKFDGRSVSGKARYAHASNPEGVRNSTRAQMVHGRVWALL